MNNTLVKQHFNGEKWLRCTDTTGRCPYGADAHKVVTVANFDSQENLNSALDSLLNKDERQEWKNYYSQEVVSFSNDMLLKKFETGVNKLYTTPYTTETKKGWNQMSDSKDIIVEELKNRMVEPENSSTSNEQLLQKLEKANIKLYTTPYANETKDAWNQISESRDLIVAEINERMTKKN
jgi:hypothetical protein